MSIKLLVQDVIRTGWLRISQEVELLQAIRGGAKFSGAELRLLLKLQEALRTGEVLIGERKKCVNVMEELVRDAVLAELLARGVDEAALPDLGDIAAYALNRLPPAYATTREGYDEQRGKALQNSADAVRKMVREAVDRVFNLPVSRPEGATPLGKMSGADAAEALQPVATPVETVGTA